MDDRVREESSSAAGTHEGGNPRIERQHEADSGHQHRGSRLDGARDASGLVGPANEYQRNIQPEAGAPDSLELVSKPPDPGVAGGAIQGHSAVADRLRAGKGRAGDIVNVRVLEQLGRRNWQ